ncbi:Phosphoglycerate mutase [Sulfitobacter noctilucae]|uniref:SixA phosphatase family protein n=1 Tax=Sulfitobacter noctilucae TaxID=1342302 RepID=UPI00046A6663|nr:histidine phosphatase family protein [Sulfitobacter noctilucae]KIN70638.1 Phosphoglycerate mutase [Sulfitobacter noctilucae]
MKRLILMRHAKSDWSEGPSSDHDRPLNARGRQAATALGDWLRDHDVLPDQMLSSSAARTKETFERLELPTQTEVSFLRPLYLASEDTILNTLKTAQGDTVLMIGHNPGIAMMAQGICTKAPDHPHFMPYPTGATLVAEFDIDEWSNATWGKANARHFTVPRDF